MIQLISSSSNVFAERPQRDFLNSTNCKIHFPLVVSDGKVICCWNDGGGETCQTCNWKDSVRDTTCDQSVIDMFEKPSSSSPTHAPVPKMVEPHKCQNHQVMIHRVFPIAE